MSMEVMDIHGLTNEMLADHQDSIEIVRKFLIWSNTNDPNLVFVGHNV
jgi:DNA polymerase III epsilon subunit-like protein